MKVTWKCTLKKNKTPAFSLHMKLTMQKPYGPALGRGRSVSVQGFCHL